VVGRVDGGVNEESRGFDRFFFVHFSQRVILSAEQSKDQFGCAGD
jgi:hypothetical protein